MVIHFSHENVSAFLIDLDSDGFSHLPLVHSSLSEHLHQYIRTILLLETLDLVSLALGYKDQLAVSFSLNSRLPVYGDTAWIVEHAAVTLLLYYTQKGTVRFKVLDPVIQGIGCKHNRFGVDGYPGRVVELAVLAAGLSRLVGTDESHELTFQGHLLQSMVVPLRHNDVVVGGAGQASRRLEFQLSSSFLADG